MEFYLRDCENTKDFNEHFLKKFVWNMINEYHRKFVEDIIREFPNNKEMNDFIIMYFIKHDWKDFINKL